MNNSKLNRYCGIFIFDKTGKLLITRGHYDPDRWEIPSWDHTPPDDYLEVAKLGVFNMTGIDFFNYKDEYFKTLKHYTFKRDILVPFAITGEKTVDKFESWAKIEVGYYQQEECASEWKYVTKKQALQMLTLMHKNVLQKL